MMKKVKEIDDKANKDDAKLIKRSNQMFQENNDNDMASIHLLMQSNETPNLFEIYYQKKKMINYLFKFIRTDDSNTMFIFWCVGTDRCTSWYR